MQIEAAYRWYCNEKSYIKPLQPTDSRREEVVEHLR